jgi:hypothetical protein
MLADVVGLENKEVGVDWRENAIAQKAPLAMGKAVGLGQCGASYLGHHGT